MAATKDAVLNGKCWINQILFSADQECLRLGEWVLAKGTLIQGDIGGMTEAALELLNDWSLISFPVLLQFRADLNYCLLFWFALLTAQKNKVQLDKKSAAVLVGVL